MSRLLLGFLFLVAALAGEIESLSTVTSCPNTHPVHFYPKTFTPSECRSIIQLMKQLPVEKDHRVDKSVKRTNYFDKGAAITSPDSKYRWIFERILPLYSPGESMESFVARIDFILLHEFDESDFFDWHVDTKPKDGTNRTDNINVMLSDGSDYQGGALLMGNHEVAASQGDMYFYPASYPHKVGDITGGRRHTFIIAMKSPSRSEEDGQLYWDRAEESFKQLCSSSSNHPVEPKFHMLYGEFLAALGRPDEEVDGKFADMYSSTAQAQEYVQSFWNMGNELQKAGKVQESQGYFNMAAMISSRIAAASGGKQP